MARAVFGMNSTSNTRQSGVTQGTPGGMKAAGGRPGKKLQAGDEVFLWVLVILEILAMVFLRNQFRRHHGG
ncbi:MAG: hypothetical protein KGL39_32100 [Patescibacteria group bacterium]|nr:hypothetical protein [Patescibacteria group bacterium]